jgi:hypothetical protein
MKNPAEAGYMEIEDDDLFGHCKAQSNVRFTP